MLSSYLYRCRCHAHLPSSMDFMSVISFNKTPKYFTRQYFFFISVVSSLFISNLFHYLCMRLLPRRPRPQWNTTNLLHIHIFRTSILLSGVQRLVDTRDKLLWKTLIGCRNHHDHSRLSIQFLFDGCPPLYRGSVAVRGQRSFTRPRPHTPHVPPAHYWLYFLIVCSLSRVLQHTVVLDIISIRRLPLSKYSSSL